MKKNLFGVTTFIVISLVFISCPDPGSGGHKHTNNPDQKAFVVFDNTYGICTALVYDDYRRRDMDRITEIPAGQCSAEFERAASTSTPFYFAYRISLKGISGFTVDFVPEVGKDQKAVRIDANTKTVIPIPVLDEAVSSQQQTLSHKSYLNILNSSAYTFQLHRGVSMIRPDNSSDSGVVNIGVRAPYTVNPGRSSDYRLLVESDYKTLPNSPDRFEAGNFYSYIFNANVSFDTQIPINLDNVDIKTYTVSFNINGGSGTVPVTQNVRAASGITLPLGNDLSKGDEIFGGWSVDASGTGVVYSAGTRYTVTGDITLYAKWYPAGTTLYTVTFDSAGGIETASQSMVSGAVAIRPPDPYRAGYTFGGWYLDTDRQSLYNFAAPVTESFTLYANWNANKYTVTFHANGANGTASAAVTVDYGIGITLPGAGGLSKSGETFNGWNTEDDGTGITYNSGARYTVINDVTLFAVWKEDGQTFTVSTPAEFDSALIAIQNATDTNYTVIFTADMSFGPNNLIGEAYENKSIKLKGNVASRTISLSSQGSLFSVGMYTELVLEDIVLRGRSGNNASLITVNTDGKLVLNSGEISGNTFQNTVSGITCNGGGVFVVAYGTFTMSGGTISGNTITNTPAYGGGVYIGDSSTFTMTGGEISGNTASSGGGVYISNYAVFTMSGGKISGNTASDSNTSGGGVYVSNGTFTMYGGEISGHTRGGGVNISYGTFTMAGGKISGNTGTGVYVSSLFVNGVRSYGTFIMNSGEISGNTISGVRSYGIFIMNGGEISGNTVSSNGDGGGVYNNRTFTMNGGEISGNTSSRDGGGVYVDSSGTFTMNGGKISGNTASTGGGVYNSGTIRIITGTVYGSNEGALSNTVTASNASGAALYNRRTVQYGTFSGETWNSNGDLITTENTIRAVNGWVNDIGVITAPTWYTGGQVYLDIPYIFHIPGTTITAQGWQISDNSSGAWINFTPSTGNTAYNRKYLRYYAVISDGQTLYSNAVQITVVSPTMREVTVEMWASNDYYWPFNALKINVNGTDLSPNATKTNSGIDLEFYTFFVDPAEDVIFYWINADTTTQSFQESCAFAVYYADDPPNPAFSPTNGAAVDTGRILLYRQYGRLGYTPDGTVLGSFTVTE